MIYFYSGSPGSGKSLHVAEEIYYYLRSGRNVIANFDIDIESIKPFWGRKMGCFFEVPTAELDVNGLYGFDRNFHKPFVESQTLLVIDECSIIFDARTFMDRSRRPWIKFFQQHRKYCYDVILISQTDRAVDRQIRALFEYEYKHRKINNFKLFGKLLGKLCGGDLFCYVVTWYGVKQRIRSHFFRGRRKFFRLYNSHKKFEGAGDSSAVGVPGRAGP